MTALLDPTVGLWLAVIASGLYHGLSPGMGWPLAVSAALMERRDGALVNAMVALAAGHLAAMLAVLLPFAAMALLIQWQTEIRIAAGLLVIALGIWILATRRHPRFLARVSPARLALWSFLIALAHGAALMLVPIYLGLCSVAASDPGRGAAIQLMSSSVGMAFSVSIAHTASMMVAGGIVAYGVYRWLGLKFLTKGWFDLEVLWALSLILVGGLGLWTAL